MAALILDASVLIGLLDSADAHQERAISDVETADQAGPSLVAPANAYSEALVAFSRAGLLIVDQGTRIHRGDGDHHRVSHRPDRRASSAAELPAEHGQLRLPDAMVLACAHEVGGQLLTYDERLARHSRADR